MAGAQFGIKSIWMHIANRDPLNKIKVRIHDYHNNNREQSH